MSRLLILTGLPGTGKTTLARLLAGRMPALHLRIDAIETALKTCSLRMHRIDDAGYAAAMAVARDALAGGFDVIADCVNPDATCRQLWRDVAREGEHRHVLVEIHCSDPVQHRRRIETRSPDLPGLVLPDWSEVEARDYAAPSDADILLDSAKSSSKTLANQVLAFLDAPRG